MTDNELLELAAKAVGIVKDDSPYNGGGYGNDGFNCMGDMVTDWHNNKTWNPLTDDGDSLRLAVKLNFGVTVDGYEVEVVTPLLCTFVEKATMGYSIEEATRRAIVRAAAEIGKGMK